MIDKQQKTEQIRKKVQTILLGSVSKAIQEIEKILQPGYTETEDELFLHNQRYYELKNAEREGTITPSEFDAKKARLVKALLAFLRNLTPEQVRQNYRLGEEIRERILVVCTDEREDTMRSFFPVEYFPETEIKIRNSAEIMLSDVQVVVYDDMLRPYSREKDNPNLENFLKNAMQNEVFVLYFGAVQPYSQYNEIAYFANSKFSLHSRLSELLDFIKYSSSKT